MSQSKNQPISVTFDTQNPEQIMQVRSANIPPAIMTTLKPATE